MNTFLSGGLFTVVYGGILSVHTPLVETPSGDFTNYGTQGCCGVTMNLIIREKAVIRVRSNNINISKCIYLSIYLFKLFF